VISKQNKSISTDVVKKQKATQSILNRPPAEFAQIKTDSVV